MRAVLMLHSVDDSGSAISLAPEQLDGLVRGILNSGHTILSLGELLEGRDPNAVALTFDDGFASLRALAAPVLSEYGASATLFLTTGYVGRDNHWPGQPAEAPRLPLLDWEGVEALHAAGWQIEAHTQTHPDLRAISDDALAEEAEAPQREIEQRLGRPARAFAYPYGLVDARVLGAVAERYPCAVTTRMATLESHEGPNGDSSHLLVPRLDAYYLRSRWLQRAFVGSEGPGVAGGFGSAAFRALIASRAALRRWRRHPGEHA